MKHLFAWQSGARGVLILRALLFCLPALWVTCTPMVEKRFATTADVQRWRSEEPVRRAGAGRDCCREYLSYAPDTLHLDHTPVKYIRVNFHIMNSADSSRNFAEAEGRKYVHELLRYATANLERNRKMFLPPGNDTPVLPVRYRYVLTPARHDGTDDGIYFHYDDTLSFYVVKGEDRNNHTRDVIRRYGIGTDSILNVFLMPHHPDSIASPTYKGTGCGIALTDAVKLAGIFENDIPPWEARKMLNHEIGHILGLAHTWAYNDGCDDTPLNPGCWIRGEEPPCDSLASNNVMDYNVYQNAWTPCQIGKAHYAMSRLHSRVRRLVQPRWCVRHADRTIVVRDSVHWRGMKDLEGDLVIAEGGVLQISCRVSLPEGARIVVEPGGRLILDNCRLHNACGGQWLGIELQQKGKARGELVFVGKPLLEDMQHPLSAADRIGSVE